MAIANGHDRGEPRFLSARAIANGLDRSEDRFLSARAMRRWGRRPRLT